MSVMSGLEEYAGDEVAKWAANAIDAGDVDVLLVAANCLTTAARVVLALNKNGGAL